MNEEDEYWDQTDSDYYHDYWSDVPDFNPDDYED